MGIINANAVFAEKKKTSVPVVRLPKNTKEAFFISRAWENGIFKVEPQKGMALYDQCYIFEDINYINQDVEKKEKILLQLMAFFKSMSLQFKITVANEHKPTAVDAMIRDTCRHAGEGHFKETAEGVSQWIRQKVSEGIHDVDRVMYLTVTCRASGYEDAAGQFAGIDATLNHMFMLLGSRIYKLDAKERFKSLSAAFRHDASVSCASLKDGTDDWKNSIVPPSIRSEKDFLEMGNTYVSVLFAHDFDQTLNDEKTLNGLLSLPYPLRITLDMQPVSRQILKEKLSNALTNNDRAMSQERSRNLSLGQVAAGVSYRLERKDMEIRDLIDQVEENDEQCVYLGLLVSVSAKTLEELAERVETLKKQARTLGYMLDTYDYRQLKAFNTSLPVGGRQVNYMRSFLTSSVVAFNPMYAKDLQMDGGIVYGLNRTTKHLIRVNRKNLKNPHMMAVGHTGSGKSFFIKETEVLQTILMTDDDMIIIDPQNEYETLIGSCGGQFFDFTPKSEIHMNPFEVPEAIQKADSIEKNKFIADKTEYATAFVTAVMNNIMVTQFHSTVLDRAVREMYETFFSAHRAKSQPTLKDLQSILKASLSSASEMEKKVITDIIIAIEQYVDGVYDMFAHESNLKMDNRLVGFGLKNVPESAWEPVMVTLMHFLDQKIKYNQSALKCTHLIVDEAQVICKRKSSADELLRAVETFRKFGGMVDLLIQNLTRGLENEALRDMLSNCAVKVFFDQGGVDARTLSQIQELSTMEFKSLQESRPGFGLLVCEQEAVMMECGMDKDNAVYGLLNTNFHEKAKLAREVSENQTELKERIIAQDD